MSFRGLYSSIPYNDPYAIAMRSLNNAEIISVIAVGNDAYNLNDPNLPYRPYPASFKLSNSITVGSITYGDIKSYFSNYGDNWVDIAAPGSEVYSTVLNNAYGWKDGTSMATPHVAGAAALLCAAYPNESASQIKARILNGARNIGYLNAGYWAKGVLDVLSAYQMQTPITVGYIEANGTNYMDGEIIWDNDFYNYNYNTPPIIKFIPIPSNAVITSIEWESTNPYDNIYYPYLIETPIEVNNLDGYEYLKVTVNGYFTMQVTMCNLIK